MIFLVYKNIKHSKEGVSLFRVVFNLKNFNY